MKYLAIILFSIFSSLSFASEEKVKVSIFGGIIEIPSNCILHVKPSLSDENNLRYICESNAENNYSNTHIHISNFIPEELDELKYGDSVTNFKVTQIKGLNYCTADYNFTIANNEVVQAQFNIICDSNYCININSTHKSILSEFLAQFGIKYV